MPGGRRWVQVEAMETPKLSVIRLEYSTETSSWRGGGSSPVLNPDTGGNDSSSATQGTSVPCGAGATAPVLNPDTVGNDSSSATQGSAVPSVAGKKPPLTTPSRDAPLTHP